MNKLIKGSMLMLSLSFLSANPSSAQDVKPPVKDMALIQKIKDSIQHNPNNLALHEHYIAASGFTRWGVKEDTAFVNQYKRWIKQFPKSAMVSYALGHAYADKESPEARPYLLKAIELNPKMDEAYFDLWVDADRWGEFKKGAEYIGMASKLKPNNPDYAFYYANAFADNPKKYEEMSLAVANRFPKSERGAQALYWLATRNKDQAKKIKYYKLLLEKYDPAKFSWSSGGASGYFNTLLLSNPAKAETLAKTMVGKMTEEGYKEMWQKQLATASSIVKAQQLLDAHQYAQAIQAIDKVKISHRSPTYTGLLLLKAKAYRLNSQPQKAYNDLLKYYAANPYPKVQDALVVLGSHLHKTKAEITEEVWAIRDTTAEKATDFSLNQYFKEGKASLADFRGKVVLLTYWFPGCGPCRGEFPHFQNVVNQFSKKDLAYVGINIASDQNAYVIPFMKSSGYSFTPLEDFEGRKKGNMDNRNAAPMNFLLDQEGNIIFKNFRIDGDNEDELHAMISSVIAHNK